MCFSSHCADVRHKNDDFTLGGGLGVHFSDFISCDSDDSSDEEGPIEQKIHVTYEDEGHDEPGVVDPEKEWVNPEKEWEPSLKADAAKSLLTPLQGLRGPLRARAPDGYLSDDDIHLAQTSLLHREEVFASAFKGMHKDTQKGYPLTQRQTLRLLQAAGKNEPGKEGMIGSAMKHGHRMYQAFTTSSGSHWVGLGEFLDWVHNTRNPTSR